MSQTSAYEVHYSDETGFCNVENKAHRLTNQCNSPEFILEAVLPLPEQLNSLTSLLLRASFL